MIWHNEIVEKRKKNKMSSLSGYFDKNAQQIPGEDRTKTLYKKMASEIPIIKDNKSRVKIQGTCQTIIIRSTVCTFSLERSEHRQLKLVTQFLT